MPIKTAGQIARLTWNVAPIPAKGSKDEQFVRDREAAKFLAIGLRTFHGLVADGKLPSYKIGGSRRYRKSELAAALVRESSVEEVLR